MLWAMTHAKAAAWRQRSDPLEEQIRTNAPYRDSAADYRVFAMARCSTMVACGTSPKGGSLLADVIRCVHAGYRDQIRVTLPYTKVSEDTFVHSTDRCLSCVIAAATRLSRNR